jgi:ParB family chromosome partitioning protein
MAKKKALGRGLRALIPDIPPDDVAKEPITNVEVDKVSPNPFQPRETFDPKSMEELKRSIAEKGVIQPITVRRIGSGFQLIAGERRLRAVRHLAFTSIPAFILDVTNDEDMLEISIIENIHREDLNPIDIAKGYLRLISECKLTQEEVSEKVGKDRSTIANFLRLLKLPRRIQESLKNNELSMGHARALISLNNSEEQIKLWKKTIRNGLSVRKVETLVKQLGDRSQALRNKHLEKEVPFYIRDAENRLRNVLTTQVKITAKSRGGKIEIEYYSDDDLDRLIGLIISE